MSMYNFLSPFTIDNVNIEEVYIKNDQINWIVNRKSENKAEANVFYSDISH